MARTIEGALQRRLDSALRLGRLFASGCAKAWIVPNLSVKEGNILLACVRTLPRCDSLGLCGIAFLYVIVRCAWPITPDAVFRRLFLCTGGVSLFPG